MLPLKCLARPSQGVYGRNQRREIGLLYTQKTNVILKASVSIQNNFCKAGLPGNVQIPSFTDSGCLEIAFQFQLSICSTHSLICYLFSPDDGVTRGSIFTTMLLSIMSSWFETSPIRPFLKCNSPGLPVRPDPTLTPSHCMANCRRQRSWGHPLYLNHFWCHFPPSSCPRLSLWKQASSAFPSRQTSTQRWQRCPPRS